jgi:hypothetical protein
LLRKSRSVRMQRRWFKVVIFILYNFLLSLIFNSLQIFSFDSIFFYCELFCCLLRNILLLYYLQK